MGTFFLFDLIDELRWVRSGPGGYTMAHALLSVGLRLPNYLYELLPITVLIGTIYVMAGLAQQLGVHHHAYQWHGPRASAALLCGAGRDVCDYLCTGATT